MEDAMIDLPSMPTGNQVGLRIRSFPRRYSYWQKSRDIKLGRYTIQKIVFQYPAPIRIREFGFAIKRNGKLKVPIEAYRWRIDPLRFLTSMVILENIRMIGRGAR